MSELPVYPRWRGELSNDNHRIRRTGGLSPLARGTRPPTDCEYVWLRFIPAGAGNSSPWRGSPLASTVYPRCRGELSPPGHLNAALLGLSPLPRGTLYAAITEINYSRFIPAGAGNSAAERFPSHRCAVYPRWRGELRAPVLRHNNESGLSPLARGTLIDISDEEVYRRFIPAGAGNSIYCAISFALNAVYPRWRGELSKSIHLF